MCRIINPVVGVFFCKYLIIQLCLESGLKEVRGRITLIILSLVVPPLILLFFFPPQFEHCTLYSVTYTPYQLRKLGDTTVTRIERIEMFVTRLPKFKQCTYNDLIHYLHRMHTNYWSEPRAPFRGTVEASPPP